MKKIIYGIISVCLAAGIFTACEPAQTTLEPNFPEQTSYVINLSAGDSNTIQLTINPNQEWRLVIPSSASDYWAIRNGSRNVLSIGGAAGEHVVEIVCLASAADLEEHSVEVSLIMAGTSQVIADITLLSGDPVLNIRPAITATSGNYGYFVKADEGAGFAYTYPETAPTLGEPITMLWDASRNGYLAYVQVESNFNWTLESGTMDISRLNNSTTNARTYTELEIFCKDLNYPATENRTDVFRLISSVEEYASNNISMSVPPFEPVLEIRIPQWDADERNYVIPTEENAPEDYDYNWLYSTDALTPGSDIQLNWRPAASATALDSYILVKSNFTLQVNNSPSWLTVGDATLQEETSNDFEMENVYRISVEAADLALEGANGKVAFGLGAFSQEFNVNYPAISNLFYVVNPPSFNFAADGTYEPSNELGMSTATNAVVNITSAGDLDIYEFELIGGAYNLDDAENGWISHEYSWNSGSVSKIQENGLTIEVEPNEGTYRRGLVMAFPKTLTLPDPVTGIFDENSELLDEYAGYIAATVAQEGATMDTGSISVEDGDYWGLEMARFDVLESDPTGLGFTSCYKLTYAMPAESSTSAVGSSYLMLKSEVPVASFRVVNMDGTSYNGTPWVNFVTTSDGYYVTMVPGTENFPDDVCIILTNGNGGDFALIQCHYDPDAKISDISLSISGTVPEGISFKSLSMNDPSVSGLGAESYWLLTYSGTDDISVEVEGFPAEIGSASPNGSAYSWLDPRFNTTRSSCTININLSRKEEGSADNGMIFFYEAGDTGITPVVILLRLGEPQSSTL